MDQFAQNFAHLIVYSEGSFCIRIGSFPPSLTDWTGRRICPVFFIGRVPSVLVSAMAKR